MNSKYQNIKVIGVDETGVGDYFTPLVSCACFVPIKNIEILKSMKVVDSKKISNQEILTIFQAIKPFINFSVRIMSQRQYNFLNKVYNAHELKTFLHLKAINALELREKIDLVIIDQYASVANISKYINKIIKNEKEIFAIKNPYKLVTKGEQEHIAVAAASIVARAYLLNCMEKQNTKWNFTFPLGSSNFIIPIARLFIKKHGRNSLYDVAKLHFKTTKKVEQEG